MNFVRPCQNLCRPYLCEYVKPQPQVFQLEIVGPIVVGIECLSNLGISGFLTLTVQHNSPGVEFRFGLRESKLILKFQLLHISMEKLILISGRYENHCENRFSDSRRISSPVADPHSVRYEAVLSYVRLHSPPTQHAL